MHRRYTFVMRKMVSGCGMSSSNALKDHFFSLFELAKHFSSPFGPNAISALKRLPLYLLSQLKCLTSKIVGFSSSGKHSGKDFGKGYTLEKREYPFSFRLS